MRLRAVLGGIALAFTPGFNVSNVGAVATNASHAYDVRLWVIGLFTTASLACGLSGSQGLLVAARAVQGVGGAFRQVGCRTASGRGSSAARGW